MKAPAASWWFTAAEIAALELPGVPAIKRRVNELAAAAGWAARTDAAGVPLSRRRAARGGGIEYHASLLPAQAQDVLTARRHRETAAPAAANDATPDAAERWRWYEAQSAATKAKAIDRVAILAEVDAAVDAGAGKTAATEAVAARHDVSPRAVAAWFAAVAGVARADRLPHLAPAYKGGGKQVEIDAEAWRLLKSDYLRPEKPGFAACYTRLREDYAEPRGVALPAMSTMRRRLEREIKQTTKKAKRQGREALRRTVPPQRRSIADLYALEAVNVDGHVFDNFVQWEDGTISRPVMVGIQDVYSRKLLAWRVGKTESAALIRGAFADLFRNFGIAGHAVMDNGRGFASKALTGGTPNRFRFRVKDTDPTGVLIQLGVKVHWTLPYRGSSKPIERAWRDQCEDIAKHPRVAGSYTGNKPDAKPENYRERAIPTGDFIAHIADRAAKHNARAGRRTETAKGRSFDEVFAASYVVSPIQRATEDHLRVALLEAVERTCNKESGAVSLADNVYWSDGMRELAGKRVIVRFDPDNLHQDVHIYERDGRYFGIANLIEATGFFDKAGAEKRARLEKNVRRAEREAEAAAELLHIDRVAEVYSGSTPPAPLPEPTVIRPVRPRGNTAAALKPIPQAGVAAPAVPDFSDHFTAGFDRLRVVK